MKFILIFGALLSAQIFGTPLHFDGARNTIESLSGREDVVIYKGTLILGGNNESTLYGGVISGSGSIIKTGLGTFTLTNTNTYFGGTTIMGNGAISVSQDSNLGEVLSPISLQNGTLIATSSFNTSRNISLLNEGRIETQGVLSCFGSFTGSGDLVKLGTGTLVLNSSHNCYKGKTIICSGILQAGTANAFSKDSEIAIQRGGILDLNHFDNAITNLSGEGEILLGNARLIVRNRNDTLFAGEISGNGGITKTGSGSLTLSGQNYYIGVTEVYEGLIQIKSDFALSPNSDIILSAKGSLHLSDYINGMRSLSGEGNLILENSYLTLGDSAYFGNISGDGGITFCSNLLQLGGFNNSYFGITTIEKGTLQATHSNSFSPNSIIVLGSNGILDLNGYNNEIGGLDGCGVVQLHDKMLTLGKGSFSGLIQGSGGLIKTGSDRFTLNGQSDYSGNTIINNGQFAAGGVNVFSKNSEVNLVGRKGAEFLLNDFDNTIANLSGDGSVSLGSATLTLGNENITGYLGSIFGKGNIIKQGSGSLILYGQNNSYTGSTSICSGKIQAGGDNVFAPLSEMVLADGAILSLNGYNNVIGNLSGFGQVLLGKGTLTLGNSYSRTYFGNISGEGGITKQGAGTLFLSGVNTYSGKTIILEGFLKIDGNKAYSCGSDLVLLGGGIDLNDHDIYVNELSGSGGSILLGKANLAVANGVYSGAIHGSGSLIKQGEDTLTLDNFDNDYSGITQLIKGRILALKDYAFSENSPVVVSEGAILDLGSYDNAILSLSGEGKVALGAGHLSLGDETNTLYSGSFTSVPFRGGITKRGSGTFTLGGIGNRYGGETTVAEGCLQAGRANVFSSYSSHFLLSGTILNLNNYDNSIGGLSGEAGSFVSMGSGKLTIYGDHDTIYSGIISGSGSITKTGKGKLTLAGANTYTGATEIAGGAAIEIRDAGQLGSSEQIILNHGSLRVVGSDTTLIAGIHILEAGAIHSDRELRIEGPLTGQGEFTKLGEGRLYLSSSKNAYTGLTKISEGSMRIEGLGLFGEGSSLYLNEGDGALSILSGSGNIHLDAPSLTVNNEDDMIYNGAIFGSSALIKDGDGRLNLTGVHSYTGPTTVKSGSLAINGSIVSPTTVALGATLQGNGAIINNVVNYGTLAPGNSIGVTVIIGDYTQASGSTLEIETLPFFSDELLVTGGVTIEPKTTLEVIPLAGSYEPNSSYPIITSGDPITGTFTNVQYSLERASGSLIYQENILLLTLNVGSYQSVAAGSNNITLAGVLDQINAAGNSSWNGQLDTLFYLSNSNLNIAYSEIIPAQLKGLAIVQENNSVRVRNGVSYRFQNLLDELQCFAIRECKKNNHSVHVWIDGLYSTLHQDSLYEDSNSQVGYHSTTGGGMIGLDVNLARCAYIGIVGAGSSSNIHWDDEQGNANIYTGYFGLYGSIFGKGPFVNASLIGGLNTYKATRNILYPGVNLSANNKHRGNEFLTHLDIGWNFSFRGCSLRPYDSVDYIYQYEQRFQEKNAGVFNLDVRSTCPQMVRNELGINFAKCFKVSKKNILLADFKLAWVLEERFNGTNYVSNFEGLDQYVFTTEGYFPNRSLFAPGVTLTGSFAEGRVFITATYDAEFSFDYWDQAFQGQIGIKF